MRRKDNSPNISFFSFQDIITSLTGIMFLIVLLLVIFLLEMKPGKEQRPSRAEAEALQSAIEQARAVLAECRKANRDLEERRKELAKLDPAALEAKLVQTRELLHRLKIQTQVDRTRNEQLAADCKVRQERNADLLRQQEAAKKGVAAQLAEVKRLLEAKDAAQKSLEKTRKTVKFTIENTSGAKPVLVECRSDGIRILEVNTGTVTDLRSLGDTPRKQQKKFLQWVKKRPAAGEYYTLLVSQKAFEYTQMAGDLRDLSRRRGIEFLPQDDFTVFPEVKK